MAVLGISAMTAIALFEGTYREGRFPPVRSVAELRCRPEVVETLSMPWVAKQVSPAVGSIECD